MNSPIRGLTCCCCFSHTHGRQWHNRDTGFGLCPRCATWIQTRKSHEGPPDAAEMERLYGKPGIHYDLPIHDLVCTVCS